MSWGMFKPPATRERLTIIDSQAGQPGEKRKARPRSERPVSWLSLVIGRWLKPGGRMLDPFSGTGTCALACNILGEGRSCVSIEIVDPVFHSAKARVAYCCREMHRLQTSAEILNKRVGQSIRRDLQKTKIERMKRS
jgi:hypothetical protein